MQSETEKVGFRKRRATGQGAPGPDFLTVSAIEGPREMFLQFAL